MWSDEIGLVGFHRPPEGTVVAGWARGMAGGARRYAVEKSIRE